MSAELLAWHGPLPEGKVGAGTAVGGGVSLGRGGKVSVGWDGGAVGVGAAGVPVRLHARPANTSAVNTDNT
jgi:hypothetical protein